MAFKKEVGNATLVKTRRYSYNRNGIDFIIGYKKEGTHKGDVIINISRKAGKAVKRNRIKRVLKEYIRNWTPYPLEGDRILIKINEVVNEDEMKSKIMEGLKIIYTKGEEANS